MEEKVVIINIYKLEKQLEESLEETFKQIEEELKDYNWDFIPEYMKIDSMDYSNLDFEISEEAKLELLKDKTKEELKKAYYWLLSSGMVTLPEYLEAMMEKGRPNC